MLIGLPAEVQTWCEKYAESRKGSTSLFQPGTGRLDDEHLGGGGVGSVVVATDL